MKVIIVANVDQEEEILSKKTNKEADMIFIKSCSEIKSENNFDAIFIVKENIDKYEFTDKPVFINNVTETLEEKKLPLNFSRIIGWPGFLKRETWEIASGNREVAIKVFEQLGWKTIFVKDEPGLVSARVISMIINEAFFALGENVSSIEEIDLAMKLGTNYPYGPFEWSEKIGLQNIYHLLHKLSQTDKRYSIAPLLVKKYLELFPS
jgi:3-hydroxybutyryl-CoA dehydrogenase